MIKTTLAQTSQFILHKTYLAERKATSFTQLLAEFGGLPADKLTMLLAAQQRLTAFQPSALTAAMQTERTALRATLMRNEDYTINVADFVSRHVATARQRRQAFNAQFRLWGISNEEIEQLSQRVREIVSTPMTMEAVKAALPPDSGRTLTQTSRGGRVSQTTALQLVVHWLVAQGVLYSDVAGHSLDMADSVSPFKQRYPEIDWTTAPDEAEAQADLVRLYLAAFGPATEADISFWSGFGKSETARAVGKLAGETTLTLVEGIPGMVLLLKSQAKALEACISPTEPRLHLLPANDPFVTAHRASRSRYFDNPKFQRKLFNSSGASKPAILVDGKIIGSWQWSAEEGLTWQLWEEGHSAIQPLIDEAVEQVSQWVSLTA